MGQLRFLHVCAQVGFRWSGHIPRMEINFEERQMNQISLLFCQIYDSVISHEKLVHCENMLVWEDGLYTYGLLFHNRSNSTNKPTYETTSA
ncbi:MAG: hypothetical protein ACK56I_01680, partial [bacterium]